MKKKKIFKKTHIFIEVLGINLHFTTNKDELRAMLAHHTLDNKRDENLNVGGKALYFQNEKGEHRFYIGLFNNDYSTLVHESTHIAFFIYEAIGQKLSYEDEVFCYLVAEIFNKCRERWIDR